MNVRKKLMVELELNPPRKKGLSWCSTIPGTRMNINIVVLYKDQIMDDIESLLDACQRNCTDYHNADKELLEAPDRCANCPIAEFIGVILLNKSKRKYAESLLEKGKSGD